MIWEKEDLKFLLSIFLFLTIFKKSGSYTALFDDIFKKSDLIEFENYTMFAGAKWPFFWYNFL